MLLIHQLQLFSLVEIQEINSGPLLQLVEVGYTQEYWLSNSLLLLQIPDPFLPFIGPRPRGQSREKGCILLVTAGLAAFLGQPSLLLLNLFNGFGL